jgi:hypothetical protein
MAQDHTHEFDCKTCGAHLDSRQQLDQHNRKNHPNQSSQQASGSVGNQKVGPNGSQTRNRDDRLA